MDVVNINSSGIITATSFVGDGSGLTGVASTDNIITGTAATFNNDVNLNGFVSVGATMDFGDNDRLRLGTGKTYRFIIHLVNLTYKMILVILESMGCIKIKKRTGSESYLDY